MSNNIKIVGQILDTEILNRYNPKDEQLLSPTLKQETFGKDNDYIEYFVHDIGGRVLNVDYNYDSYKLPYESHYSQSGLPDIEIDPIQDVQNLGYQSGEVSARYNFFRKIAGEPFGEQLFIQQISSDRTEIRVNSTDLSNDELLSITSNFVDKQNSVPYYYYLILNFGENKQVVVTNVLSNVTEEGEVSVLFKLYEPLPSNINLKDKFWVVEEITNPYTFDINLDKFQIAPATPVLRGPNFDIDLPFKQVIPTSYNNYNQLVNFLTGSSYKAVLDAQKSKINIDYSVCGEFSHYGSIENRLSNFIYKIGEIEIFQSEIDTNSPLTSSNISLESSVNRASSSIDSIIGSFDGFESYLYFTSSSISSSIVEYVLDSGSYFKHILAPYPKSGSVQPYVLYPSSSATVQTWYSQASDIATSYDVSNKDILLDVIPSYIVEDEENYLPYIIFVNMIGQHFDNIWLYINKLTNVWDSDNSLDKGISRDLLYDWLQSFGVKLYNTQGDQGILEYSKGSYDGNVSFTEDYSPTSSFLNNVPKKDLILDTYKRIYHNLPYLFKSKGSYGGLQSLINIFGITGSILSVKEYGGTNDFEDIKGYNSNKISIQSNGITGSILSSVKRLETSPTSSRDIKSQDVHFVDISFSPQNQVNAAISSSITAVSSSWVLDQFIGNPTDLSLDSYPSLTLEKEYWFGQTFSGSFDQGGFIRLIQFFDNSLFKMVKDFVPARSNTWTGISIKSPVLERPKVPQFHPMVTCEGDYEGGIAGSTISPVYDEYYGGLEGNKESYYTGDITGSYISTYEESKNPFLTNSTVDFIPPGLIEGNVDFVLNSNAKDFENFFKNSDFDALQNNVENNVESVYRKKITPIMSVDSLGRSFTSYSIEEPVQLQDSNLTSTPYVRSRHDGIPLYGKTNNTWTIGDSSYGQSSVIDYNVRKLGLFTEIVDNIYLPNKSNATLKYLVDENGKLTELNKRNRNWEEVQNTFKIGDFLNISLFDPQKYSNQRFTDGNKKVHESGYSYHPVFYAFGSESIDWNTSSVFLAPQGESQNVLDRYFSISSTVGSLIPTSSFLSSSYSGTTFEFWNIWNITGSNSSNGTHLYPGLAPGTNTFNCTSSYYSVPEKANYDFVYDFSVKINATAPAGEMRYVSSSMEVWIHSGSNNVNSASLSSDSQVAFFTGQSFNAVLGKPKTGYRDLRVDPTGDEMQVYNGYTMLVYENSYSVYPATSFLASESTYKKYKFIALGESAYRRMLDSDPTQVPEGTLVDLGSFWVKEGDDLNLVSTWPAVTMYSSLIENSTATNSEQTIKFRKTVTVNSENVVAGDKISFRLFLNNNGGATIIDSAVMQGGTLKVIPSQGSITIDGTGLCFDQQANAFVLNKELSPFFGPSYYFDPLNSVISSSYSSSYALYGNVNYPFDLDMNDKIVIQAAGDNGPVLEYTVDDVIFQGSSSLAYIHVREDIDGYFNQCNKFYKIIFLKRVIDETSIIVNFKKPVGKTSYGFSIPSNISPSVLNNIDNINKNVNKQLIDVGIGITT